MGKVTLEHVGLSSGRYNFCRYSLFLIQFVHESYVTAISSSSHPPTHCKFYRELPTVYH
jgi:hypothetical protein